MAYISREQALCISFQLKFTEANAMIAEQRFARCCELGLEVCYLNDPNLPVMVSKEHIYGNPDTFHEYISAKDASMNKATSGKQKLGMRCSEAFMFDNYLN